MPAALGAGIKNNIYRSHRWRIFREFVTFFLICAARVLASQNVTLAWDPSASPSVTGYKLHYGSRSGSYAQVIDVGNTTKAMLSNLTEGSTYFVVVTAYNRSPVESPRSNEIAFMVTSSGISSPTPTATPTSTPTPTPRPIPTPTPTPRPTATPSATATPHSTPRTTPTPAPRSTPISTPMPTPVSRSTQNCLVNGDFETGPYNVRGTVAGWSVSSNGHVAIFTQGATSSTHSAGFNEGGDSQGNVLYQSFATVVGQIYSLDFDAAIYGLPTSTLHLQVQVFGATPALDRTVSPPSEGTSDPNSVVFRHYHFTFAANSTSSTLRFCDIGFGNSAARTVLDTVSVVPGTTSSPTALPKIGVIAVTKTVNAGDQATFKVFASKKGKWSPLQPTLIRYGLGGTATAGVDYTPSGATGQVIIPAGSRSTWVRLNTLPHPLFPSNKTVTLTILPGNNYNVLPRTAIITIVNR
jgi:hypothetical protein